MDFASDNTSAVAPEIMAAIVRANEGFAPAYGQDDLTAALETAVARVFEHDVAVFPVTTGTAANALGLALLTPPHGAVFCHEGAHIHADECGAPEFFTAGAKLVPVPGAAGKLTPAGLAAALALYRPGTVHEVQSAVLSLTQATEAGTVYRPAEIAALAALARERGMAVHMDGARLANALATLGVSPADATWRAGVDVLALGATKNGAMAAEAVVAFDPARARDLAFRRKRGGHLLSKGRFLSAQLLAYLDQDLWLRLAAGANAMARRLAEGLAALPGVRLVHPVEANEVFAVLPPGAVPRLEDAGARFYRWIAPGLGAYAVYRFVTSWSTTPEAVDRFLALARSVNGK